MKYKNIQMKALDRNFLHALGLDKRARMVRPYHTPKKKLRMYFQEDQIIYSR